MRRFIWIALLTVLPLALGTRAAGADGAADYLKKPADWCGSGEARRSAGSILSWQSDLGGWPKNVNTATQPYTGDRGKLRPTFDNGATTDELRLLSRVFNATGDARYEQAAVKGVDYILHAQYPTGGWPQFHPPGTSYHRHITFNDGAMVRIMLFLREVNADPAFGFLDAPRRQAAQDAFDRGVQCILKCQVKVEGKLTAWCAQHDEKDFQPRPGRSYELASLSGAESVGLVRLLMSLDRPSPQVIAAVEGAVAWFEAAKLPGLKVVTKPDPAAPKGTTRVAERDPATSPMWARFHEIGTNRPIFSDRDGVAKHDFNQLGYERRNGYAWLGYWPQDLLAKEYPAWKQRIATQPAAR